MKEPFVLQIGQELMKIDFSRILYFIKLFNINYMKLN